MSTAFTMDALPATVVGVRDGDTLIVLRDRVPIEVRLEGIDAPESGQAFGNRAKQAASALAFGKLVTVEPTGADCCGRLLADVLLPDGRSLNAELVRQGWARWFRRYAPNNKVLAGIEGEARDARRGLWADPKPVAPWDWRAGRAATEETLSAGTPDASTPPAAPAAPLVASPNVEILTFCAKQRPADVVMQAHCVEQQEKAAEALRGGAEFSG